MSRFKIKVARIEAAGRGMDRFASRFGLTESQFNFEVPISLSVKDFDDTGMIQAARNALYRTFAELAFQSQKWKLTAEDLQQLSSMSLRPKP
jgi:hypothetical protein